MSSNFPFTATRYRCFFPLCITGTTSVGCFWLCVVLSIGFCDCIGLTCATCLAFGGSVETGPTVKRRENICHIQTIKCKAPHTKLNLHALLPDVLESVLEFKFVQMSLASGKQY